MLHAIEAATSGTVGVVRVGKLFGVPKSTLHRKLKGNNKQVHGVCEGMGSLQTALPRNIEPDLVNHIHLTESLLFGLSLDVVRCLAYQLADVNGIDHLFNTAAQKAGWFFERDILR